MTTMLFYKNLTPLNRDRHRNVRFQQKPDHFAFASVTNSVLLAGSELGEAARQYPVVFVGQEGGPFTLAALVGLQNDENLLTDSQGNWENGAYIPAFVRRYPFVLADDNASAFTVCVDESCPGINDAEGVALFDAEGNESEYLKGVVEFLRVFHQEMTRTTAFAAKLAEFGLLEPKVISIERAGQSRTLDGFWVVDEARLSQLNDAQVLELHRAGYMGWIYAHLLSLNNVGLLARRLDLRQAA